MPESLFRDDVLKLANLAIRAERSSGITFDVEKELPPDTLEKMQVELNTRKAKDLSDYCLRCPHALILFGDRFYVPDLKTDERVELVHNPYKILHFRSIDQIGKVLDTVRNVRLINKQWFDDLVQGLKITDKIRDDFLTFYRQKLSRGGSFSNTFLLGAILLFPELIDKEEVYRLMLEQCQDGIDNHMISIAMPRCLDFRIAFPERWQSDLVKPILPDMKQRIDEIQQETAPGVKAAYVASYLLALSADRITLTDHGLRVDMGPKDIDPPQDIPVQRRY